MMEVGIVIGVLVALKLFFWICYFCARQRRKERTAEALQQIRAIQMAEAQRQQRVQSTVEALRQLRALQMANAGLIHPAPTPGSRNPPIVTHGQAPGVHAQPNNNTTTTPNATGDTDSAATPPSYQEAVKSPSLPQETPPPYIE